MRRGLFPLLLLVGIIGCGRTYYRQQADRDTYNLLAKRRDEKNWATANLSIVPPPSSRLFDPFNTDRPPMPPDDPAAHYFMEHPGQLRGSSHYLKNGQAPFIEASTWRSPAVDQGGKAGVDPGSGHRGGGAE